MGVPRHREGAEVAMREAIGFDGEVLQSLLALRGAAAMVVSREFEILACRGDFAPLFPALQVNDLASLLLPSTRVGAALGRMVQSAARSASRHTEVVAITSGAQASDSRVVRITAFPAGNSPSVEAFVIVFEPAAPPAQDLAPPPSAEAAPERRLLETVIEDYEINTEALQAAHEELRTANEELARTNQDLEDSWADLDRLNQELQEANSELTRANQDLVNIVESIAIPVLILDSELRVRRFNRRLREMFHVVASDVGRPIASLHPRVLLPDFAAMCRQVLEDFTPREREVQDSYGGRATMTVRAYRTAANHVGGVVVTLVPAGNVHDQPSNC